MHKTLLFLAVFLMSANASAKTVVTLYKSSYSCSIAFESKADSKRIKGQKYLSFRISDIQLSDLYMAKTSLESSVDSQWLNTGEKYYISAYINSTIGPKHIPMIIPERSEDRHRYVDIDVDKYLPCSCFKGAEKPSRCVKAKNHGYEIKPYKE